jgi:hypothetical protein
MLAAVLLVAWIVAVVLLVAASIYRRSSAETGAGASIHHRRTPSAAHLRLSRSRRLVRCRDAPVARETGGRPLAVLASSTAPARRSRQAVVPVRLRL